jgi:hypothetical protein
MGRYSSASCERLHHLQVQKIVIYFKIVLILVALFTPIPSQYARNWRLLILAGVAKIATAVLIWELL